MNNNKPRNKKTFTIRLQASEGTPLAEIIDYLNQMDRTEAIATISETVRMCLLPLARHYSDYKQEKIRLTCLEACRALSNYAIYLRQALMGCPTQFEIVQENGLNNFDLLSVENLRREPPLQTYNSLTLDEKEKEPSLDRATTNKEKRKVTKAKKQNSQRVTLKDIDEMFGI